MYKVDCAVIASGLMFVPVFGQPREWKDDFTVNATYDSDSLVAPCSGGPSTKYSLMEALTGDFYNQHAVSGGGRLALGNRVATGFAGVGRLEVAAIGILDLGQTCPDNPDPSPGASLATSEPFTSDSVCMYAGHTFNPWHLKVPGMNSWDIRGTDGQPGIAGVDDDLDGATDENDESSAARSTPAGGGYGDGVFGFRAGGDAAPGISGVDDDANGVIDDIGETGWAGSDDGDDTNRLLLFPTLDGDFASSETVYLALGPASSMDQFSIWEMTGGGGAPVEYGNEITYGFYQANTDYNWIFCSGGTCYGAMLWVRTDISNPVETIGPVMNSNHTGPTANVAGIIFMQNSKPIYQYIRQNYITGNRNFSDTFWVVSGNPALYYPSPSSDLDGDRDVDGFDFLTFSNCYNGSNRLPLTACTNRQADLDRDGDVDGFDFLTFSNCYNGSNRRPLAACFPPNLTGVATCTGS